MSKCIAYWNCTLLLRTFAIEHFLIWEGLKIEGRERYSIVFFVLSFPLTFVNKTAWDILDFCCFCTMHFRYLWILNISAGDQEVSGYARALTYLRPVASTLFSGHLKGASHEHFWFLSGVSAGCSFCFCAMQITCCTPLASSDVLERPGDGFLHRQVMFEVPSLITSLSQLFWGEYVKEIQLHDWQLLWSSFDGTSENIPWKAGSKSQLSLHAVLDNRFGAKEQTLTSIGKYSAKYMFPRRG